MSINKENILSKEEKYSTNSVKSPLQNRGIDWKQLNVTHLEFSIIGRESFIGIAINLAFLRTQSPFFIKALFPFNGIALGTTGRRCKLTGSYWSFYIYKKKLSLSSNSLGKLIYSVSLTVHPTLFLLV